MCKRTFGLFLSGWVMIATAQAGDLPDQLQSKTAANPLVMASGLAEQQAQWDLVSVAKVQVVNPAKDAERYLCGGDVRPCVGTLSTTGTWGRTSLSVMSLNGWTPYFINSVASFVAMNFPLPDTIQLFNTCLSEAQPDLVTDPFGFCLRRQDLILNQISTERFSVIHKKSEPGISGKSVTF